MVILGNFTRADFMPAQPTILLSACETQIGRHCQTDLPSAALAGHIDTAPTTEKFYRESSSE